jgi:hypothetical protein
MQPKVFRNFLNDNDFQTVQSKILEPKWSCNHKSSNDENNSLFWKMEGLETDSFFSQHLFNKIKELTQEDFEIERIYFNGHNACGQGYPHTDSEKEDGRTFLIYCNDKWDLNFGGGTSFLIDNEVKTYFPYPNSAVYFNNNILHMADPIGKDFKGVRVTLAFKLYIK